jgi:uncharacterized protein YbjQ (UPF0145 family)
MEEFLGLIIVVILFLVFTAVPLFIWYKIGKHFENKHYDSIRQREERLINLAFTPSDTIDAERRIEAMGLVTGQVVIGSDPFKRYIANLVNLVGGRISVFEAPLDRARREAILRMKEQAVSLKADEVINFRIETMSICGGKSDKPLGIVEVFAYGTAVRYAKS